ncbi:Hypothetical protein D9617_17g047220 [Elsinoe fawcettii]|nr:Hypothetical protein D9617_17g047220 [Elsinoe fawcettii]
MTAEDVGRKLLAEVEESVLSEVFSEVRLKYASIPTSRIGIAAIDDLVNIFARPLPTEARSPSPLVQHYTTQSKRQAATPPCIELSSTTSGQGKSHLLYQLITRAILPASINGTPLHGQINAVLYFDTDGHFSITRLVQVMIDHIRSCITQSNIAQERQPADEEIQTMVATALQHLHVFFPQSMMSLIQTIDCLMKYLKDNTRHPSMHRKIHSIMIDSVSAFYWSDRNDTDLANVPDTIEEATYRRGQKTTSAYPALRSSLTRMSRLLQCPIVYTSTDVQPKQLSSTTRSLPSSLPKLWHTFPDLRLLVQRRPVRGFPVATNADEAVRDAKERNAAAEDAPFEIVVNEDNREDWSREVRDEIARTGRSKLTLRISNQGVQIAQ